MKRLVFALSAFALTAAPALAADVTYEFRVDGMTCPFCVATSEKALRKIDGVKTVSTDLEAGVITVCADESVTFTDEQMKELFLKRGFSYRSMTRSEGCKAA
jgi:copper chaperone CopZ